MANEVTNCGARGRGANGMVVGEFGLAGRNSRQQGRAGRTRWGERKDGISFYPGGEGCYLN